MEGKAINELPEGITQEMVNNAKEKFVDVRLVQLPKDDDGVSFFNVLMKRPSVQTIGQYSQFSDKSIQRANDILLKGVLVDQEDFKTIGNDTGLYLAAIDAASTMIPSRKPIVKNL